MQSKGQYSNIGWIILWIVFFIIAGAGVYFLLKFLTKG